MNDYDKLTTETRAHLDQSVDDLEPEIAERLAAARARAVRGAAHHSPRRSRAPWAAAGVAASVALVAVLATFSGETQSPEPGPADMELMAADEPLEFYQDLEFYLWLEEQAINDELG